MRSRTEACEAGLDEGVVGVQWVFRVGKAGSGGRGGQSTRRRRAISQEVTAGSPASGMPSATSSAPLASRVDRESSRSVTL